MFEQVDDVIRAALTTGVPGLGSSQQVRFSPPDDDWRTNVANLHQMALNVYLVDLRENRRQRETDWITEFGPDGPRRVPPPARVDCHYLISAWSPATPTPAVEPTRDEHALLYAAYGVLSDHVPLNPSRVYPPGSAALAGVDELIRDAELPVQIAPSEGWPKLAEFWGAMGSNDRWKPAIWYVVTVPVALRSTVAGPPVTTRIVEYRQTGRPESAERWAQIGGTVSAPAGPVAAATVTLTGPAGPTSVTTDDDGRFTAEIPGPGSYAAGITATGHPTSTEALDVPSADGTYDLTLT